MLVKGAYCAKDIWVRNPNIVKCVCCYEIEKKRKKPAHTFVHATKAALAWRVQICGHITVQSLKVTQFAMHFHTRTLIQGYGLLVLYFNASQYNNAWFLFTLFHVSTSALFFLHSTLLLSFYIVLHILSNSINYRIQSLIPNDVLT